MPLTIASWNVNSLKVRLPMVLDWLSQHNPDVVLLQELKMMTEAFPHDAIRGAGYHATVLGQKTYNGVAVLSREAPEDVVLGLPGFEDEQARYAQVTVGGVTMASIYLPNGNPLGTEKFSYKLRWMERLIHHARKLFSTGGPVILGGDYNVIPADRDVYDPRAFANDALTQPETRAAFRTLLHQGWTEAFRALHPEGGAYTFWDYQGGAWQKGHGLRIDHFLLSPEAADALDRCWIDTAPRGWEKASDHTPILASFAL